MTISLHTITTIVICKVKHCIQSPTPKELLLLLLVAVDFGKAYRKAFKILNYLPIIYIICIYHVYNL